MDRLGGDHSHTKMKLRLAVASFGNIGKIANHSCLKLAPIFPIELIGHRPLPGQRELLAAFGPTVLLGSSTLLFDLFQGFFSLGFSVIHPTDHVLLVGSSPVTLKRGEMGNVNSRLKLTSRTNLCLTNDKDPLAQNFLYFCFCPICQDKTFTAAF